MVCLGPLTRLRLFGLICPCHESDEEFAARVGVSSLQSLGIQWHRIARGDDGSSFVVFLDATLYIIDSPQGPTLQVQCYDPKRLAYTFVDTDEGPVEAVPTGPPKDPGMILLEQVDRIAFVDTADSYWEIQIMAREKSDPVLRFQVMLRKRCQMHRVTAQDAFSHLIAVLQWDRARRADLEDLRERALSRFEEERARLTSDVTMEL